LGDLGTRSDDFVKKWAAFLQDYEVQKAKVLDEDDEVVEKLNNELNNLKQQLREALHHIKLEEVQKACFEKID
jgi:type VI protein secretion system component VasK